VNTGLANKVFPRDSPLLGGFTKAKYPCLSLHSSSNSKSFVYVSDGISRECSITNTAELRPPTGATFSVDNNVGASSAAVSSFSFFKSYEEAKNRFF
jgi:hypothetical protein